MTKRWIINSLLENDAYKFNMMQVVLHQFSKDMVKWAFKCRNDNVRFTPEMIADIREQIDHFCTLRFTEGELSWLRENFPWLSSDYIDRLREYQPRRCEIFVNEGGIQSYNDCGLAIEAVGTELHTMLYEVPILAIVNEVYFAHTYGEGSLDIEFQKRTMEKFSMLQNGEYDIGTFSEFGMRRRYSSAMQDWLVKYIVSEKVKGFAGTSNVFLAKKYGMKAIGTQAHEFFMLQQGHFERNPAYSNMFALNAWVHEYETRLGIALTDTIGTEVFLKDFGLTNANLFSGVRHDSGDPKKWGNTMIGHYKSLGIDPMTKTLLFSDSLDFKRATEIKREFNGRAQVAFGIGTYLSNDCGVKPLNVVMKLVEVNGNPVCKLSNDPGKSMCRDESYMEYLRRSIEWRLAHDF